MCTYQCQTPCSVNVWHVPLVERAEQFNYKTSLLVFCLNWLPTAENGATKSPMIIILQCTLFQRLLRLSGLSGARCIYVIIASSFWIDLTLVFNMGQTRA